MTNEEKEALYQEFKARMMVENTKVNPSDAIQGARRLFTDEFETIFKSRNYEHYLYDKGFNSQIHSDWDKIRIMVLHTFGCSTLNQLPVNRYEEANRRAEELVKLYFSFISAENEIH